jgi:signal transduction histidine kinase
MKSVKSKLILALVLVELLTLGMAVVLYAGARRFEDDARGTRQANDDLRELVDFSLSAHAYMNAFGRSLGQRTLVANRQRREAATAFDSHIARIPETSSSIGGLPARSWLELRDISTSLSAGLRAADALRATGNFVRAEQRFAETRQTDFDEHMLPWFSRAISTLRLDANRRQVDALGAASRLRITGAALACASPLLALVAIFWITGSVIRPIHALAAGAEAIGRGDMTHRMNQSGADEFALVAASFNRMVDTIAKTQATLVEKNAKLEEAYRMQGEFVSMVTHELRSPLHSIRGYLEFLEEDEPGLSAQSKNHLASIGQGAQRLLRLVDDILDFSKLEAKAMQIVTSRFELNPLLEEALFDARALLRDRPIALVLESPSEPLYLESDYTRLRQILTNLLSNAVKFTEQGTVSLVVDIQPEHVELTVRDTGIGIPEAQLGIIFEPFRQAESVGGHAAGGTGLGLAIVARLAELIHARVRVRSEPGQGSAFSIALSRLSKAPPEDLSWRIS